ncbi:hypothetical protein [Myroides phaeus]|uniref:SWIM-type domain-containing protein n=1 Tax=Myroides phaeus TaxID=702745 RepID=A0A1G8DLB3_9FLAO|nr:hypothetical protein [Myroides phaeus]SDH58385.1 hypothetical protein SAMN05421818_10778 [Myroides phaeus]
MKIETVLKKTLKRDIAKATVMPVRELEEEEKGHFIAFVDDAEHSYDVSIVLQEEEVKEMQCDCAETTAVCLHKIAVLLAMNTTTTGDTKATKAKGGRRKKKLTESEELMLSMDKEVLMSWLSGVFKKNKPLEQQFTLTFSTKEVVYTKEQVKEIAEQAIFSVAGKRKTLEAAKIKKVLDLLTIALEPIDQFVVMNISKPVAFEIFTGFLDTIYAFDKRITHYSKRIGTYVDQYIEKFALSINNIQDEKVWEQLVKAYFDTLFKGVKKGNKRYNYILAQQLYLTGTKPQKLFYGDLLNGMLSVTKFNRYDFEPEFTEFLLKVALEEDFFEEVRPFFKRFTFEGY